MYKVGVVGRRTRPGNSAFRSPHSALFRGLHPQTIVESIEVLGHPNDEGNFDDLSLIPRSPQSPVQRSEEHTSELQSQSNLVCRLLLEKKKKYLQPAALLLVMRCPPARPATADRGETAIA